jgi:hypothetical protein
MAITKPEFWLVTLGFIIIMSFALLLFGNSLSSSSEATLDADSISYLSEYTQRLNQSGMTGEANKEPQPPRNPVLRFLSGVPGITEILAVVNIFSNVLTGVWDFFALAFKLPTFFLATLGLNLGAFGFVINVISTVLFLAGTIMLVRLIK